MYGRYNNKRRVETFLVASGVGGGTGQALYNTAGGGNHINNTSTGAVRLADGQLGIFAATTLGTVAMNVATDATPTITEAPAIYVAQGTADSANPAQAQANATYPLVARPYERSGDISANSGRIIATKQAASAPTNSIWVVGDTGALATGGVQALDETEYSVTISYRGRRVDEFYNSMNTNSYTPSFTTPNYTSLGTAFPVDHLVQNIVWQINRNSRIIGFNQEGREPVVAMALDLTGNVGTDAGTLTAGFLPLITTNIGTRGITLDANQAANLAAVLPSGSSIVNVDLTTAGTADAAQAFAVMALDETLAYNDFIPQVKIRIDLGLRSGFDWQQVYNDQVSFAHEGENQPRQLDIEYKNTHGQRKYNLQHESIPVIEYPSPIDFTHTYVRYNIDYFDLQQIGTFSTVESPSRLVVLIPTAYTTTISQWDGAIDSWLTSAGADLITIS